MMKPIEEAKAKERQTRKPADSVPQNSSEQKESRQAIADLAGVSHDTIRKVEAIKEFATPEIIQAARTGALSVNLAAQVAELPEEAQRTVSSWAAYPLTGKMRTALRRFWHQGIR